MFVIFIGGGVIKQRIAHKGGGRFGEFRKFVLFRRGELAFFVYGFVKSDRANLRRSELATFRLLAGEYLALDGDPLAEAACSARLRSALRSANAPHHRSPRDRSPDMIASGGSAAPGDHQRAARPRTCFASRSRHIENSMEKGKMES